MNPKDDPANITKAQNPAPGTSDQPMADDSAATPMQPDGNTQQTGQAFREVSLPAEAEDTDLIEKEWVERAKQIVEHTRDDPHEQQRALSQMKADYLKKRYNKDIKVTED